MPDVYEVIDALAVCQVAQDNLALAEAQLAQALRKWSRRTVKLSISIDGREPTPGMATEVNDVSFLAVVEAQDAAGRKVDDPNPFTWTVDPADAAAFAADPTAPDDSSHVMVNVAPADAEGNQRDFTLNVTDGALTASEECTPIPGAATRLIIRP